MSGSSTVYNVTGNETDLQVQDGAPPPVLAVFWVVFVLRVLITIFGIVANSMVVYVVARYNDMRTYSNGFCASLAIADNLMMGHDLRYSIPEKVLQMTPGDSLAHCMMQSTGLILMVCSGFHLLVIAFDRFLFINFPFRYRTILHWAVYPLFITCWLPSNLLGAGIELRGCLRKQFVQSTQQVILRSGVYGALMVLVTILYTSILRTALHQRRLIQRSLPAAVAGTQGSELDTIKAQIKALIGFILIGVSTFLNWLLPTGYIMVVHLVITVYGQVPPSSVLLGVLIFQQAIGLFMSINSAVNPIIYSFTQRPFKESFAKTFRILMKKLGVKSGLPLRKNTATTQLVTVDDNRPGGNTPSMFQSSHV